MTTHRARRLVPIATLLAVVLSLSGCSDDPADEATSQPSPTATTPDATGAPESGQDPDSGAAARGGFDDIPDIIREVQPSVVSIELVIEQQGRQGAGAGSGVIWDGNGHIVTNSHVVGPASEISVVLASGERLDAEILAMDPRSDLAVITVERSDLPAAEFSEELPDVGELAIAMGNPLGLQNSATAGIVSGLGRSVPVAQGVTLIDLIQTDAPISPGNSGGALVDAAGHVIGINVAQAGTQVAENLGFAIPSSTVVSVVEELIGSGEVTRPYLGVQAGTLTPQIAERFGLDVDRGAVIAAVEPGGPADEAGLEQGDVIVGLAGQDIETFGDMATVLRDHEPGDTVELTYVRGDTEETVELTLGEMPAPTPG